MTLRGKIGALVLLTAFLGSLTAQVIVEDDIVTSEINLFDINVENQYSLVAAIGLSAALPGMGHYYVDRPGAAFVYMGVDIASIFGSILFYSLAEQQEKEARSYAHAAAMIEQAPSGTAYWRHVGAFMDAAEYNDAVELSRGDAEKLYDDPKTWWRWGDESQKDEYNNLRQKARYMRTASSFFVGALVANRVISIVDLRVSQKKSLSRGVRFESAFVQGMSGVSFTLKKEF